MKHLIVILKLQKNWKAIQKENKLIFSKKFRSKFKDSLGKYWKINWNCVDHVNFLANPQVKISHTIKFLIITKIL